MSYPKHPDRPATVKLSVAEWTSIVLAVVQDIGRDKSEFILANAIGEERTKALINREGVRITKDDTRQIVAHLYPHIPGLTRHEKKQYVIDRGREVFADDDRFLEVLAFVRQRIEEYEDAGGTINEYPEPDQPKGARVNRGGDGLYKPSSNLWLLPARNPHNGQPIFADHIGRAGEFKDRDGTQMVKHFVFPNKTAVAGRVINFQNKAPDPHNVNHYHPAAVPPVGRLKCRGARATNDGNWFIAWDIHGQRVFEKHIQEAGVRQE